MWKVHRRTLSDIILLFANRNFAHFILSAETSCIWKEQAFSGPFIRKKGPFSPSCQEYGSWLNGAFRGMECSFQTFHDILNLIVKGYWEQKDFRKLIISRFMVSYFPSSDLKRMCCRGTEFKRHFWEFVCAHRTAHRQATNIPVNLEDGQIFVLKTTRNVQVIQKIRGIFLWIDLGTKLYNKRSGSSIRNH